MLPAAARGERRASPPFELQTEFADWYVDGPNASPPPAADGPAARAARIAAVEALVGERVIAWELDERLGLRLRFAGGHDLVFTPWVNEAEPSDAWSLVRNDVLLVSASSDGEIEVHAAQPPRPA